MVVILAVYGNWATKRVCLNIWMNEHFYRRINKPSKKKLLSNM